VDGYAVFRSGVLAGDQVWAEVPASDDDHWSSAELTYGASFGAGGTALRAKDRSGGDVDWFTVDGDDAGKAVPVPGVNRQVIPGRLNYRARPTRAGGSSRTAPSTSAASHRTGHIWPRCC
jgi:hypothetical protein